MQDLPQRVKSLLCHQFIRKLMLTRGDIAGTFFFIATQRVRGGDKNITLENETYIIYIYIYIYSICIYKIQCCFFKQVTVFFCGNHSVDSHKNN